MLVNNLSNLSTFKPVIKTTSITQNAEKRNGDD